MKLFRPIILAAAIANNANHVVPASIDDDYESIPSTTITGLRLSDWHRGGMGRRLFTTGTASPSFNNDDGSDGDTVDAIEGIDDLQRDFFSVHGRNFTEQELNDALDDAYYRAMANDGANLRFKFDEDLLFELERGRALKADDAVVDASDQHERSLQASTAFPPSGTIIRGGTGMIISLQSPGFPGNPGYRSGINGLFWCASLRETARADIETPLNQKLTLKNCKLADIREIEWTYASNFELLLSRVGTLFHEFCARTEDGKQDRMAERIRLNQCGIDINTTQSWELYTNYQWRSAQNENLCVATGRGNDGGGSLKLQSCVGPNPVDMFDAGQLWALCRTEASCSVGTGQFDRQLPVKCDINQDCGLRRRGATLK
mmetsp:Transcript_13220/g.27994  ORF Transcript_13220/g.27994 Transcript_13220/m.27994 type:complete len:375 (+) Transcript_13220:118-1242(+)